MARLLTTVIIAAFLGAAYAAATSSEAHFGITFSAATKKSTSARRQEAGQIACTVAGCQRIPPNCHPETGHNWDGIPTGFDIVVCRYPARLDASIADEIMRKIGIQLPDD